MSELSSSVTHIVCSDFITAEAFYEIVDKDLLQVFLFFRCTCCGPSEVEVKPLRLTCSRSQVIPWKDFFKVAGTV
jgi:hypothetical protein